jgi:hypothetical protein
MNRFASVIFFRVFLFAGIFFLFPSSVDASWYYIQASGAIVSNKYSAENGCNFVKSTQFGGQGSCVELTCEDTSGHICKNSSSCPIGYDTAEGTCMKGYSCCKVSKCLNGGICVPGTTCGTGMVKGVGTCDAGKVCCAPKSSAATSPPSASSVEGKCTGYSTSTTSKEQGVCRDECASGSEKQDGVCSETSGTAYKGKACCVPVSTASTTSSAPVVTSSVSFSNPLAFDTVQGAVATLLGAVQGLIVWLSLLFVVIGGVLYVTSAGAPENIKKAKGMITAALIGLAIGVAAPSFLKEVGTVLGWGSSDIPSSVSGAKSLTEIVQSVLNFMLSIAGLLAILMMVIGGFMYFAAAGDQNRADTAKNIVQSAVIGIAVVVTSLIIIRTVAMLVSGLSGNGYYY